MLHKLSVRSRLFIGFGILITLLLGTLILSRHTLKDQVETLGTLTGQLLEQSAEVGMTISKIQGLPPAETAAAMQAQTVAYSDPDEFQASLRQIKAGRDALNTSLESIRVLLNSPEAEDTVKETKDSARRFSEAVDKALAKFAGGEKSEGMDILLNRGFQLEGALIEKVGALQGVCKESQSARILDYKAQLSRRLSNIEGNLLFIGILATAVAVYLAVSITSSIVKPVNAAMHALERTATGDLTAHLQIDSEDEMGRLAAAVNQAMESLRATLSEVVDGINTVASAATELSAVSSQVEANSEHTMQQAQSVSRVSSEVNDSVQNVAAASEQNAASIREIAGNLAESVKIAASAVQSAQSTNQTMERLGASSAEIGEVVKTIRTIAEQTNLLALNATIEAARAGEAGRGFAVVATEVKELAKGTALATNEISHKIEAIQRDTRSAIDAIVEISSIVEKIDSLQHAISNSVEEQTTTTNEISRSIQQAANGAREIDESTSTVAQIANNTTSGAVQTKVAANELAQLSAQLTRLVSQFKVG